VIEAILVLYSGLLAGLFAACLMKKVRWRWFLVASIPALIVVVFVFLAWLLGTLDSANRKENRS